MIPLFSIYITHNSSGGSLRDSMTLTTHKRVSNPKINDPGSIDPKNPVQMTKIIRM